MKILIAKKNLISTSMRLGDLFPEFPFISWIPYMLAFLQSFKRFGSDLICIYILHNKMQFWCVSFPLHEEISTYIGMLYLQRKCACVCCGGIFAPILSFLGIKSTQVLWDLYQDWPLYLCIHYSESRNICAIEILLIQPSFHIYIYITFTCECYIHTCTHTYIYSIHKWIGSVRIDEKVLRR